MKTNFYKIIYMLAFIGVSSCEEFLDVDPNLGLSEEDVFSSYSSTRGYLDNCYEYLLDIHHWRSQNANRNSINVISDEGASPFKGGYGVTIINSGNWVQTADNRPEVHWSVIQGFDRGSVLSNASGAIRITNKVITNVESGLVPNLSETQKNELLGQAYFFRSWYYFQMIMRVGGMPILDKAFASNDVTDLTRSTYQESSAWLVEGLDKAIEILPDVWPSTEFGRVTKGAAMAVKSMATLYAASPLMQNNIESTVSQSYNIEMSEKAAEYANDLIQYINAGSGGAGFRLMNKDEYKNIFYTDGIQASPESIWYRLDANRRTGQTRGLRCNYIPQRFSGGTGNDATGYSGPTQNIIDMYEVINGSEAYPIDDARSGYDPQNPWVNRDPRLYNNVIVPGEEWGVNSSGAPLYQELYEGGSDYNINLSSTYTTGRDFTGYMIKKYLWPEANTFTRLYELYNINTIYIRVAQVYLDYAEAMNEAYGPNSDPEGYGLTAVQAINIIRNRVDMPDVLSENTSSTDVFRDIIRKERATELMWENHRWHDLRRWMIAEEVYQRPIRGVKAIPPVGHTSVSDKSTLDFTYEYFDLATEQRVFNNRHYWYPIKADDANNSVNYKQNPGW